MPQGTWTQNKCPSLLGSRWTSTSSSPDSVRDCDYSLSPRTKEWELIPCRHEWPEEIARRWQTQLHTFPLPFNTETPDKQEFILQHLLSSVLQADKYEGLGAACGAQCLQHTEGAHSCLAHSAQAGPGLADSEHTGLNQALTGNIWCQKFLPGQDFKKFQALSHTSQHCR